MFKSFLFPMLISSIIFLLSSNAVTSRRDKSILYARVVITILISCFILSLKKNPMVFYHENLYHTVILIEIEFFLLVFILSIFFISIEYSLHLYNSPIQLISQMKSYSYINLVLALSLAITVFSFVGVPPLIGFLNELSTSSNYFLEFTMIVNYFTLIIMYSNYKCKEKKVKLLTKLYNFFCNLNIYLKFIKTHFAALLFKLLILVVIGWVINLSYIYLVTFKLNDPFLLHANKCLFIYSVMSVVSSYLFNSNFFKKKVKLNNVLNCITLTRFLIVFCFYIILVYFGLAYDLLVYILSFMSETLIHIIENLFVGVRGLMKFNPLGVGFLKKIIASDSLISIRGSHFINSKSNHLGHTMWYNYPKKSLGCNYIFGKFIIKSHMYSVNTLLFKKFYISNITFIIENLNLKNLYIKEIGSDFYLLFSYRKNEWKIISSNENFISMLNSRYLGKEIASSKFPGFKPVKLLPEKAFNNYPEIESLIFKKNTMPLQAEKVLINKETSSDMDCSLFNKYHVNLLDKFPFLPFSRFEYLNGSPYNNQNIIACMYHSNIYDSADSNDELYREDEPEITQTNISSIPEYSVHQGSNQILPLESSSSLINLENQTAQFATQLPYYPLNETLSFASYSNLTQAPEQIRTSNMQNINSSSSYEATPGQLQSTQIANTTSHDYFNYIISNIDMRYNPLKEEFSTWNLDTEHYLRSREIQVITSLDKYLSNIVEGMRFGSTMSFGIDKNYIFFLLKSKTDKFDLKLDKARNLSHTLISSKHIAALREIHIEKLDYINFLVNKDFSLYNEIFKETRILDASLLYSFAEKADKPFSTLTTNAGTFFLIMKKKLWADYGVNSRFTNQSKLNLLSHIIQLHKLISQNS